jgi:hypothetical protein
MAHVSVCTALAGIEVTALARPPSVRSLNATGWSFAFATTTEAVAFSACVDIRGHTVIRHRNFV